MTIQMWNDQTEIFATQFSVPDQGVVAALPNGNYVAVGRYATSIRFQIVDAAGAPVGVQKYLGVADPSDPEVAVLPNGRIIIAWSNNSTSIEAQEFAATGEVVGDIHTLGASAAGRSKQSPALWAGENGYATVWADTSSGSNSVELRFTGTTPWSFSINTGANVKNPDVTRLGNGKFVVVLAEGSSSNIKAVIVDNNSGTPSQTSVTIPLGSGTTDVLGNGASPVVTAIDDAAHSFIVTHCDGSGNLKIRKFNGNGVAVPSDLVLDTGVTNHPFQVVALAKGGFEDGLAVAYVKTVNGHNRLFVTLVKPDGTSTTPVEVQASSGAAQISSITELADGRISITWDQSGASIDNRIVDGREIAVTVNGTEGADYYIGTSVAAAVANKRDILNGNGGDDRLEGGANGDNIDGGEGTDTAEFRFAKAGVAASLTTNSGTAGDADGDVYSGIENFYGSRYDDVLEGDALFNKLTGWTGNDTLDGAGGADTLDGGDGNDFLEGGEGNDTLEGGEGNDEFYGRSGSDSLIGGEGNDRLNDESGNDTLIGGLGDDYLGSEADNDSLIGGEGNDSLSGGTGSDSLIGGIGDDSYYVDVADTITEIAGQGTDTVHARGSYTLAAGVHVEILRADGDGNVDLTGNEMGNVLHGNSSNTNGRNNRIDGGGGADTLVIAGKRAEYNVILNADGSITLERPDPPEGGKGTDTILNVEIFQFSDSKLSLLGLVGDVGKILTGDVIAENSAAGINIGTFLGSAKTGGPLRYDLITDAEGRFSIDATTGVLKVADGVRLDFEQATSHSITVRMTDAGGASSDKTLTILVQDVLDERAFGSAGADGMRGGAGQDYFSSLAGNDWIEAGLGNDTLIGGAGKDVLTGGLGKDIFVFGTKASKATNLDTITDFVVKDDTIWLDNAVFRKLGKKGSVTKPSKLNAEFLVVGDKAREKDDYLIYNKKKGVLYYDADGSGKGKAVEIATLKKNLKMTTADLFVI